MAYAQKVKDALTKLEQDGHIADAVYDDLLVRYSKATGIEWAEIPPDIETFLTDPAYSDFNKFMWPEVLKEAIAIVESYEGGVHEGVLEWAIGTGKSTLSTALGAYFICRLLCMENPQKTFNIAPDEYITVLNMSRNARQARRIVFHGISNRIKNSQWFRDRGYMPDPKVTSELRFPKHVVCLPGNSSSTYALGYNIIYAILDEANFYEDKQGNDNANEVWDTMQRRVSSRFSEYDEGFTVAISSTTHDQSFTRRKAEEKAEGVDLYYTSKTILDVRPRALKNLMKFDYQGQSYLIPIRLKNEFRRNPSKALRDYYCIAAAGESPYMPTYAYLKGTVQAGENPWDDSAVWPSPDCTPRIVGDVKYRREEADSRPRYIHVDLGFKKDACGLVMAHVESVVNIGGEQRPVVEIDLAARITPKQMGGEIIFANVRKIIYELRDRGFNIGGVTYDGFASEESIQTLQQAGFQAELLSIDKDLIAYETLKEAILEGRILWRFYEPLLRELSRLQLEKGKKVDHPSGGTKDVSDAAAGACLSAIRGGAGFAITWM